MDGGNDVTQLDFLYFILDERGWRTPMNPCTICCTRGLLVDHACNFPPPLSILHARGLCGFNRFVCVCVCVWTLVQYIADAVWWLIVRAIFFSRSPRPCSSESSHSSCPWALSVDFISFLCALCVWVWFTQLVVPVPRHVIHVVIVLQQDSTWVDPFDHKFARQ